VTEKELAEFMAAAERTRIEHTSSPEKARQFLMDSGYLDKDGEIAPPYRSAVVPKSCD
jgi:hypothetical protein